MVARMWGGKRQGAGEIRRAIYKGKCLKGCLKSRRSRLERCGRDLADQRGEGEGEEVKRGLRSFAVSSTLCIQQRSRLAVFAFQLGCRGRAASLLKRIVTGVSPLRQRER